MKKLVLMFVAIAAMSFASCNGNKQAAPAALQLLTALLPIAPLLIALLLPLLLIPLLRLSNLRKRTGNLRNSARLCVEFGGFFCLYFVVLLWL